MVAHVHISRVHRMRIFGSLETALCAVNILLSNRTFGGAFNGDACALVFFCVVYNIALFALRELVYYSLVHSGTI